MEFLHSGCLQQNGSKTGTVVPVHCLSGCGLSTKILRLCSDASGAKDHGVWAVQEPMDPMAERCTALSLVWDSRYSVPETDFQWLWPLVPFVFIVVKAQKGRGGQCIRTTSMVEPQSTEKCTTYFGILTSVPG